MIQYDQDVMRDTVTDGEGVTFYYRYGAIPVTDIPTTNQELLLPLSDSTRTIGIPTFQVNGRNELFFCGSTRPTAPAPRPCTTRRRPTSPTHACAPP